MSQCSDLTQQPPDSNSVVDRARDLVAQMTLAEKIGQMSQFNGGSTDLRQLVREGRLAVVDGFTVDAPKTKLLDQKVKGMGMNSVLIITEEPDQNLYLSSRNLPHVDVVQAGQANPVSLLHFDSTIITKAAVAKIEEMLS